MIIFSVPLLPCSKFPDSPEATEAFQKVSVAYDVLSKPASKRKYDTRPATSPYDFTAHPYQRAEETFRSVVLGVFNDFLDGDLETVRTLLRECLPCDFLLRPTFFRHGSHDVMIIFVLYCVKRHILIPNHTGAVNDYNPSLRLGDDGIDAVLNTLQAIRQRALSTFRYFFSPRLTDTNNPEQHVGRVYLL